MEISNVNNQARDSIASGNFTGIADPSGTSINGNLDVVGNASGQINGSAATNGATSELSLQQGSEQLTEAATTATASVFFSLLQNILSEAQNNSGS